MANKNKVQSFIKSQKSIWLYKKTQKAFYEVLCAMPQDDYAKATKNLILMVLHEGAMGQVMHFPNQKGKFKILQLSIAREAPLPVLKYVIAHELGHVMQGRNWKKSDKGNLEINADEWAKKWGFPKTKNISKMIQNSNPNFSLMLSHRKLLK